MSVTSRGDQNEPYGGDDRENYGGLQWSILYETADDARYLGSFSFPAFTVIDDGVYVLCTRLSTKKNYTTKVAMVNRFLCQIRRPMCRWLIYVGSKDEVSANHAAVKGLAYVDPKVVLSGANRLWGRLPMIDGVEVMPPVQLGIPAEYAEHMRKIFNAKLPVIFYSEESYIALNRHHIVFGDEKIVSPVVSSYAMRENLMCGGHPTAAAFSGLFHMKDGQGGSRHAVVANGMILGQNLYGVGHFGSLCSNL
jgi:hypothetical protein